MRAFHAVFFKLVNEFLAAILANDGSHGPAAFWQAERRREMNVDFWLLYAIGSRRLNVDEGDLFDEDDRPVFERDCFHSLVFPDHFLPVNFFRPVSQARKLKTKS